MPYPQPTPEQKSQIIKLTKQGLSTGEMAGIIGLPKHQVRYHKRKMPLKSFFHHAYFASRPWMPGKRYILVVVACLANGREITVGTKKYPNPPYTKERYRLIGLVIEQLSGKEIDYAARRAPWFVRKRKPGHRYYEAIFSKLPPGLKQEFGYR